MKKQRNSGIEFLRIVAMLAIVAGHFVSQGGVMTVHGDSLLVHWFGSGALVGVNIFLVIGCWFMVDARFRRERPIGLYLTVLLYTVPLTVLTLVCGAHPSLKDVMRGVMPFTGRALWFASAYISLMILTPWLSRVLELPKKSLVRLVIVLFILICGVSTLPDPQTAYLCNCLWFVYVYLFVGCLKRHFFRPCRPLAGFAMLSCGVALYSILVLLSCRGGIFGINHPAVSEIANQYLHDFKTLPNFAVALLVFIPFASMKACAVPFVDRLARPAFDVYVIHQTPAFYPFLWKEICCVDKWNDSPHFAVYAVGVVAGIYVAGCLLEPFRSLVVSPLTGFLARKISRGVTSDA